MASGIKGVSKLRRTLRRIEPATTAEVRTAVEEGAEAIKLDAISFAPVDEGDLVRSIEAKISRDGLTAIVGPGALNAKLRKNKAGAAWAAAGTRMSAANQDRLFQFFKGHWIEFGTKGNPKRNIPPQPARPFMAPAYDLNKDWILARTRRAIREALEKASHG